MSVVIPDRLTESLVCPRFEGVSVRNLKLASACRVKTMPDVEQHRRQSSNAELSWSEISQLTDENWQYISEDSRSGIVEISRAGNLTFSSLDLYGREKEISTLKEAFDRSRSSRELLLISGQSGSGKSALASCVEQPVRQAKGFYLKGKFDLNQQGQPFSAIVSACSRLCEELLQQEEGLSCPGREQNSGSREERSSKQWQSVFSLDEIRTRMHEEMANEVEDLIFVVPGLADVVGIDVIQPLNDSTKDDPLEARNRLNAAFRKFIRVLGCFGPIAMFLDDMQWADLASLELIEFLFTDPEKTGLLILGCYRDTGLDDTNGYQKLLRKLKRRDETTITEIEVRNLSVWYVNEILSDLLRTEKGRTLPLAELVHRKTHGNAFFAIQFIKSLVDSRILKPSDSSAWAWDLEQAEKSTEPTSNVIDLMKSKLKKLPYDVCLTLQLMACLGSTFTFRVFHLIVDEFYNNPLHVDPTKLAVQPLDQRKPEECLQLCVEQGLIVAHRRHSYRWIHDKLQEAALSLLPSDSLPIVQFRIGNLLRQNLSSVEIESSVFVVAALLNEGSEALLTDEQRIQIARIDLVAGKKAIESSAFVSAKYYLEKGVELLPVGSWNEHYRLTLNIYSTAAEAEYCNGNAVMVERYCDEVLKQIHRPLLDRLPAYKVLIETTGAQGDHKKAAHLTLDVLSQLGCPFPKYAVLIQAYAGLQKARLFQRRLSTEKVNGMRQMTDIKDIWIMSLLDKMFAFAYVGRLPNILLMSILKSLQWTLKKGLSDFAPSTFARVGLVFAAFLNDPKTSEMYAEHCMSLLVRTSSRIAKVKASMIVQSFVFHYLRPLSSTTRPLTHSYELGMKIGAIDDAMWCFFFAQETKVHCGVSLNSIADELSVAIKQMQDLKQLKQEELCYILERVVLDMTGNARDAHLLSAKYLAQDELFARLRQTEDTTMKMYFLRNRMAVAFLFERYDLLMELLEDTGYQKFIEKAQPGVFAVQSMTFRNALACVSVFHRTGDRHYLRLANRLAWKVKKAAKQNNPNLFHYDALLDAEFAATNGKHAAALKHFGAAILLAGSRRFQNDQALIYERFGEYNDREGQKDDARYSLRLAIESYQVWGARGKANQIRLKHAGLLTPPAEIEVGHFNPGFLTLRHKSSDTAHVRGTAQLEKPLGAA